MMKNTTHSKNLLSNKHIELEIKLEITRPLSSSCSSSSSCGQLIMADFTPQDFTTVCLSNNQSVTMKKPLDDESSSITRRPCPVIISNNRHEKATWYVEARAALALLGLETCFHGQVMQALQSRLDGLVADFADQEVMVMIQVEIRRFHKKEIDCSLELLNDFFDFQREMRKTIEVLPLL